MQKRAAVFVAIVLFGFGSVPHPANAVTVPIDPPPASGLQRVIADLMNGAGSIVASIEAGVGGIIADITNTLTGAGDSSASYTAAVAAPSQEPAPNMPMATAVHPTSPTTSTPLPPSSIAHPINAPSAVGNTTGSVPIANVFEVQSALGELATRVQGLSSLLSTNASLQPNIENQIATLRSAISSQGYNAAASPPLGGGAPNTIAAASAIDQLSGTNITNPSITGGSIANTAFSGGPIAANSLSVSGDTSLSGNLNVVGNFSAGSISFGAASSTGSITTNSTTTNLAVTGTSYFGGNVGIGTTSPSALLTLDSSSATGTILRISNRSTGGHVFDLLSTGSGNTSGAGRLDIFDSTAGLARLSIAANGNVGVGTTSPFTSFAVNGSGYFSGNLTAT